MKHTRWGISLAADVVACGGQGVISPVADHESLPGDELISIRFLQLKGEISFYDQE